MNKQTFLFGFAIVVSFALGGWIFNIPCPSQPQSPLPPETLIEVQVIESHFSGDTIKEKGFWREPFSYTIYERTDTHERRLSNKMLGKVGDKFSAKWSDLTYSN